MIIGFRHKGLGNLLPHRLGAGHSNAAHAKKLRHILGFLEVAAGQEDMNVPSFKLHQLKGDLKGHWSVWVNGNWRVTFRFTGSNVELVDYQDYH